MSDQMLRREFVSRLIVLSAACSSVFASNKATSETVVDSPWIPVRPANKFKSQVMQHIVLPDSANDEEIYVTVDQDRNFSAFWSRCTHQGCIVNWKGSSKQFVCPCHGGKFDSTGQVLSGPPQKPLRALAVKVDNSGMLMVQFPVALSS